MTLPLVVAFGRPFVLPGLTQRRDFLHMWAAGRLDPWQQEFRDGHGGLPYSSGPNLLDEGGAGDDILVLRPNWLNVSVLGAEWILACGFAFFLLAMLVYTVTEGNAKSLLLRALSGFVVASLAEIILSHLLRQPLGFNAYSLAPQRGLAVEFGMPQLSATVTAGGAGSLLAVAIGEWVRSSGKRSRPSKSKQS